MAKAEQSTGRKRKKNGKSRPPGILDDAALLPQGSGLAGPTLAGSMVGRHRNLEILYVGQVLNDALAIVGPLVDAIGEMGPVFHDT